MASISFRIKFRLNQIAALTSFTSSAQASIPLLPFGALISANPLLEAALALVGPITTATPPVPTLSAHTRMVEGEAKVMISHLRACMYL